MLWQLLQIIFIKYRLCKVLFFIFIITFYYLECLWENVTLCITHKKDIFRLFTTTRLCCRCNKFIDLLEQIPHCVLSHLKFVQLTHFPPFCTFFSPRVAKLTTQICWHRVSSYPFQNVVKKSEYIRTCVCLGSWHDVNNLGIFMLPKSCTYRIARHVYKLAHNAI